MAPMKTLKLGTRRSLLARAQSSAVARDLERAHPGLKVELVGIDTRGDLIQNVPLSQVDGKEFFTAEIDAALASGEVDLTVHSFKDLALERPVQFTLGAVPKRQNPRDIIFFARDVREQLARGATLRIGSSSPRRIAFVPGFLAHALPHEGAAAAKVELVPLRGNVDTRLRRLREPRGHERQLDGVILAFAGLSRLWQDEVVGAAAVLRELLDGLPRMLLPLTHCPAAPAQGALAIECRTDDAATRAILAAIDDPATRVAVAAERKLLAERGGGCHQQFGATQLMNPALGALLHVREADEAGAGEPELRWEAPAKPAGIVQAWDGSAQPAPAVQPLAVAAEVCAAGLAEVPAAFIAHKRALPATVTAEQANRCAHLWVSGAETWFALASRGVWVEGCAESLGFAALRGTLSEPLLHLAPLTQWLALTNEEAADGWHDVPVLATYRHAPAEAPAAGAGPHAATHAWWHSSAQFERFRAQLPPGCRHACGPGKTAEHLRDAGVTDLQLFPSVRHWRAWLGA
jgi:hydroxymethylbilane synthase